MESVGESTTTPIRYERVAWTQARNQSLKEAIEAVDPSLKGIERENELEKEWHSRNPTLPSKGKSLMQQLYRVRKRKGPHASQSNPGAETEPEEEPEPEDQERMDGAPSLLVSVYRRV